MDNNLFFDTSNWKYTKPLLDAYDGLLSEFDQFAREEWSCTGKYYTNSYSKSEQWKCLAFMTKSQRHEENIDRCPTVKRLLDELPIYDTCAFTILHGGAHIPIHTGFSDRHLRVHLGIRTDGQAWIRVKDQTRHWQEKQVLIFDDWAEHEVRNPSLNHRVIFLFDIERKNYFDNLIDS